MHLSSHESETTHIEGYEQMSWEDKNKGKFFATFPYPYMNGFLHLGHAFSMSKCEFSVRYQKQLGKNVLFPFAFHCTGMPIHAAALRLRREIQTGNIRSPPPVPPKDAKDKPMPVQPTWYEILISMGIPEEEITNFQDPIYWLRYFPPRGIRLERIWPVH